MNILLIGIVVLGIGIALFFLESKRELKIFRVTDYTVSGEKLKGLTREYRAVFLSDLHNKVYGRDNRSLIEAIRQSQPDFILIGGDMLIGKRIFLLMRLFLLSGSFRRLLRFIMLMGIMNSE